MPIKEVLENTAKRVLHIFTLRRVVFVLFLTGCVAVLLSQVVILSYRNDIHTVTSTPAAPVALIFGAGVKKNGEPTDALHDRVLTGVELYHAEKVDTLIMTGDNGTRFYNEVAPMRDLAIELGVPVNNIVLDYAGFRTYDSCYRARDVFGVTSTIVVSQAFHIPRILFTCRAFGIYAEGVGADKQVYLEAHRYWPIREFLARFKAFVEVYITHPEPKFLGEKEIEWQKE